MAKYIFLIMFNKLYYRLLLLAFAVVIIIPPAMAQKSDKDEVIDRITEQIEKLLEQGDELVVIDWLADQGLEYSVQKEVVPAAFCFDALLIILKLHIAESFIRSDHAARDTSWRDIDGVIKLIEVFALDNIEQHPNLSTLAYNCELISKSVLLDMSSIIRRGVMVCGNEELMKTWIEINEGYQEFTHIKAEIRAMEEDTQYNSVVAQQNGSDSSRVKYMLQRVKSSKTIIDSVFLVLADKELEIIDICSEYVCEQIYEHLNVDWRDIRDALTDRQAVVEYFVYETEEDSTCYGVLIIRKDSNFPQLFGVDSHEQVIALCGEDRYDMGGLEKLLWRGVESYLDEIDELFLIRPGILNSLPFSAFRVNGEYLMDRYEIHNLLSGRDVVHRSSRSVKLNIKNALLVGGVDFDFITTAKDSSEFYNGTNSTFRGIHSMRGQGFGYLPGSLKEAVSVSKTLADNGWNVKLLMGDNASELNLRSALQSPSPTVIHLSTHGFYTPQSIIDTGNKYSAAEDPMMRHGLLFAGANKSWILDVYSINKSNYYEDGILRAKELMSLDLRGTELVVLSACGTGLGDVDKSEGVYGLQRAFREAGVKNILVSLWEVSDSETTKIMTSFYTHLTSGLSPNKALYYAQKEARERNPNDPYLWSGFMLIE